MAAAAADEAYARSLDRQCWGLPGRPCTNLRNGGYDLCGECYRLLRSVPHVQPNVVKCSLCNHGYVYLGMQCDNSRCVTNENMGEDASYEEMLEREQKDRTKRSRISYDSKKKEDYFDVTKYKPGDGETCAICLEDFKKDEEVARLCCDGAHLFHKTCIDESFKMNGMRCPTCNLDLVKKGAQF